MDETRHTLLRQLPHGIVAALHTVAAKNGVTVDDVVNAQLGRKPVPEGAVKALDDLRPLNLSISDEVAKKSLALWPYACGACGQDFAPNKRPLQCPRIDCTVSADGGKFARDKAAADAARAERADLGASLSGHLADDVGGG